MKSKNINYTFYPPERPSAPGSSQLGMVVREPLAGIKTGTHDLEQVKLRIATHEDLPELTTLSHPWPHANQQQVCVGNIALHLMTDERIIAFTFGGDLHVKPRDDETLFILASPAPILRLEDFDQISAILADEVSILLAERRVKEFPELDHYRRKLVCTDPLTLYCSCLEALESKFGDSFHPESPSLSAFISFLNTEIESLHAANLWSNHIPDLVSLL
jgi:hypothetical protein